MTSIPCFLGTCSIDLDADPVTGQLIANARTADTGSLDCVDRLDPDETDGLFVQVSGLTQDATSGVNAPCGQSLGRAVNGDLFAYPEGALAYDYLGVSLQAEAALDDETDPDDPRTDDVTLQHPVVVNNPWDCAAWCLYTLHEMKVVGNRVDGITAENFWLTAVGNLSVAGGITDVLTNGANNRIDIHGMWDGAGNAPEHAKAIDMHAIFRLSAGGVATITNEIVIAGRRRFNMFGGNSGVFFLHPTAVFWREDARLNNAQP